jgi:hypothetical protein
VEVERVLSDPADLDLNVRLLELAGVLSLVASSAARGVDGCLLAEIMAYKSATQKMITISKSSLQTLSVQNY